MLGRVQTVAPTVEPITLAEAKLHLKQDAVEDDALISSLIVAARRHCESRLGQQLVTATYRLTLDCPPCGCELELPVPPLQSVTSFQYIDIAGATQTWDSSKYLVDTSRMPGRVYPAWNVPWPNTRGDHNCYTITFVAGYGDAAAVPDTIKAAIKLLVGHWYEHREAASEVSITSIPLAVDSLLAGEWHGAVCLEGIEDE